MNETMDPKLKADLDRQLKAELKSDSDNPVPAATIFTLRQKFGLAPLTLDDFVSKKGTRR